MKIDKHCTNVYQLWPDHYMDFWNMYKSQKNVIRKYALGYRSAKIDQYLKSHFKSHTSESAGKR